jgi:AcrR family transcriptional regulator
VGTQNEILAAAREILTRKGERGVTMRAVAERVGVTATAIYRHYRDKAALLEQMARTGFEALG